MTTAIFLIVAALAGVGLGFYLPGKSDIRPGEDKETLKKAREDADRIYNESKEQFEKSKKLLEQEEKDAMETLKKMEESLKQKEEIATRREQRNNSFKQNKDNLQNDISAAARATEDFTKKSIDILSKTSGINREEALEKTRENLEKLILEGKESTIKRYVEEVEEDSIKKAKAIIQCLIQRMGTPSSVDKNSTYVPVKDDKFKGLLIGKNGANIIYLESLLPVAVIFNIDPENILVGGINLLRRNIAKRAIEKMQLLVKKTGAITHEMIKKAVDESEKEIMAICDKKGLEALKIIGIDAKTVNPEMINYIGRMYFRTSFGQNIIWHSLEMGILARMIAEQIGANVQVAMEAAFYHDIGKAIDHDVGGAHDDLSKEILEKFGYDPRIVYAAFAHHDKVPCEAPEDFIVKAVDAISAVRPGARQESVSNYFERIKQLEDTAASFEGVRKTYAISAGREVRVIVDNDRIKDGDMEGLANNVAGKISEELSFPGIIKVNLIRMTRSSDYAREKK
jgi:ribonuclease Y